MRCSPSGSTCSVRSTAPHGAEVGGVDRPGARHLDRGLLVDPAADADGSAEGERADHGCGDDEPDRGDEVVGARQPAGGEEGADAALLGDAAVSPRAAIRITQIAAWPSAEPDERRAEEDDEVGRARRDSRLR